MIISSVRAVRSLLAVMARRARRIFSVRFMMYEVVLIFRDYKSFVA
jgi:hypothetical protein